jgi:hypothetical protein
VVLVFSDRTLQQEKMVWQAEEVVQSSWCQNVKIIGIAHHLRRVFRDARIGHEGHANMNAQKPRDRSRTEPPRSRPKEPMDESRYQELMRSLNHLFVETEHDTHAQTAAERQRVIEEIQALMNHHGLTVEDLDG